MSAPITTEQRDLFQKLREAFEANRSKGKTLFECAQMIGMDSKAAERFVNMIVADGTVFYARTATGLEAQFME